MRLNLNELFALYVMNEVAEFAPGIPPEFNVESKIKAQQMFSSGQKSLVKRGLGSGAGEDREIIGNGQLFSTFMEQQDYIRVDNITIETSNNQIMGISITEIDERNFELTPLYKGFLFAHILDQRPRLLQSSAKFQEKNIRAEKVIEKLDPATFREKYGHEENSTFIQRYENKKCVYSRILFESGFVILQYDLLTEELKESVPYQTACQLYQWMDILEMDFSREELHEYFDTTIRGENNGAEN